MTNAASLRRDDAPTKVIDATAYLARDESSFLNGVNIDISGGMVLS